MKEKNDSFVWLDQIGHVNFVGSCRRDARKRLRSLDSAAADALVKSQHVSSLAVPQSSLSGSQQTEVRSLWLMY